MRLARALAYLGASLTPLAAEALLGVSTEIHADATRIEAAQISDVKRRQNARQSGRLETDELAVTSSNQSPVNGTRKSWFQRAADELLSQTGRDHMEEPAVLALWSSMDLIAAALCGLAAVHVCDRAQRSSVELLRLQDSGADWRTYLRQMPESVSRSIHLTNSPYGTVFKALLISCAVLMLNSNFPRHDLSAGSPTGNWGFFWTIFSAFRGFLPTLGILSEVFIPMSDALVQVRERFKQPGHKLSDEDKYIFLESRFQEKMHVLAGILTFMVVPAVEGVAVAYSFMMFFSDAKDDMVHWKDGSLSAHVWLAILLVRVMTIFTSDVCMLNMAYEGWMDTRYLHNPFFMYIPERQAVNSLFCYILLMGLSIWFVSEPVWLSMSPAAKVFAFSLTVVVLFSIVAWIVRVFSVLCNKRKNLTGNRRKNLVSGIIEEQKIHLAAGSPAMEELEAIRQMYEEAGLAAAKDGMESDEDEGVDPMKCM